MFEQNQWVHKMIHTNINGQINIVLHGGTCARMDWHYDHSAVIVIIICTAANPESVTNHMSQATNRIRSQSQTCTLIYKADETPYGHNSWIDHKVIYTTHLDG